MAQAIGSDGHLLAVEPHVENVTKLVSALEPYPQAKVSGSALTARNGPVTFYPCSKGKRGHLVGSLSSDNSKNSSPGVTVQGVTIDALTLSWPRLSAIKLDLQGSELWALHGGKAAITQWHPLVMLEIWPKGLEACDSSVEAILAWFRAAGYVRDGSVGVDIERFSRKGFVYTDWLFAWQDAS